MISVNFTSTANKKNKRIYAIVSSNDPEKIYRVGEYWHMSDIMRAMYLDSPYKRILLRRVLSAKLGRDKKKTPVIVLGDIVNDFPEEERLALNQL